MLGLDMKISFSEKLADNFNFFVYMWEVIVNYSIWLRIYFVLKV